MDNIINGNKYLGTELGVKKNELKVDNIYAGRDGEGNDGRRPHKPRRGYPSYTENKRPIDDDRQE